jgi:hypothetical protein
MVATPLNEGEQFSALDGLHIVFVPVIADGSGIPTRLEINAGTDLTTEVESWEGFEVTPEEIETPSLARFTGTIPGRVKIESGTLRLYADRGADDVRDVLPDGTTGAIVFMDVGDVATKLMDIWPVRVNKLSKVRSTEAATMLSVKFSHPRLPKEDAAIPAAA